MPATPTLSQKTLRLLGIKPNDFKLYTSLLELGTAPLRRVAQHANINRGTAYDGLRRLIDAGLVRYVNANTHRYFTAKDPQQLKRLATRQEVAVQEAGQYVQGVIPQLQQLRAHAEHRPSVRYYEGHSGIRDVLESVLHGAERTAERQYLIYSARDISELINKAWPAFTQERIRRRIRVKAIALDAGGVEARYAERRWLSSSPRLASTSRAASRNDTYTFLFDGHVAYISRDNAHKAFGVIMESKDIYHTQSTVFHALWDTLENNT